MSPVRSNPLTRPIMANSPQRVTTTSPKKEIINPQLQKKIAAPNPIEKRNDDDGFKAPANIPPSQNRSLLRVGAPRTNRVMTRNQVQNPG